MSILFKNIIVDNNCRYVIILLLLMPIIYSQLIRTNDIYQGVIIDIYKYYEFESITFFYDSENDNIETIKKLRNLQHYFSRFYIKTLMINVDILLMNIKKYSEISPNQQSFFIILQDTTKIQTMLLNSLSVDISKPAWLIFLSDDMTVENYFLDIHIPFNCIFMVSQRNPVKRSEEIISEIYRIDRNEKLRYDNVVKWSPEDSDLLPKPDAVYERRTNFYGHIIRVAVRENPPFSMIIPQEDGGIKQGGYYGDLMAILQEALNFTCQFYPVATSLSNTKNSSTPDGISTLVNKITDIFPIQLAITPERQDIIDFLTSTSEIDYQLFIKKTGNLANWNSYFLPFKIEIWILIPCFIFIACNSIAIVRLSSGRNKIPTKVIRIERENLKFINLPFSVFGIFCSQAMKASTLNPIRIIQFTLHITAVLLQTSYSALLISSLSVYEYKPPFTTLEGLLNDGTYEFGIQGSSVMHKFFERSENIVYKQIYHQYLKGKIHPVHSAEGLERVCREDKYAFLSPYIYASLANSENCTLIPLQVVEVLPSGLGVQKNSPYRDVINDQILHIKQSGLLQKITERITSSAFKPNEQPLPPSVEMIKILPLLLVVIASQISSLLLLWIEIYINRSYS